MNIVRYRGGLGNQMFQYAFQRALENNGYKVQADLTSFIQFPEHNGYELKDTFGIELHTASDEALKTASPYYFKIPFVYNILPCNESDRKKKAYQSRKSKKRLQIPSVKNAYYAQQDHCSYDENIKNILDGNCHYLDGLWQNVRYFDNISEIIKHDFKFKENITQLDPKMKEAGVALSECDSVAIHVRRGDFVNSKSDICSETYYRKACEKLGASVDSTQFYFFTDDFGYIDDHFKWITKRIVIDSGSARASTDMYLMTQSKKMIISNSSFSFWGAYLNKYSDVEVIAPKYSLIKDDKKYPLCVPDRWVTIEV